MACNGVLGIHEKEFGDAGVVQPGFELSIAKSRVRLVRGQSATVDVSVQRSGGFTDVLAVFATPLPKDVSSDQLVLAPSQTTATLTLRAAASADRGSATIEVYALFGTVRSSKSLQLIVQDPSGTPDLTFGGSGRVAISAGIGDRGVGPGGLKLTPQTGSIVLCGHVRTDGTDSSVALARLTSGGAFDPTFGDQGIALGNSNGSSADACESMFLRAGGGINLAGYASPVGAATRDMMAGRYTPAGIVDKNTGDGGFVTTHIDSADSIAYGLLPVDNDGYVSAGGGRGGAVFVRYQKYGALEPSFGSNGTVTIGPDGSAVRWLAQQSSQNIVAAVESSTFRILRLTPAGRLDTSFATGGAADLGDPGSSAAVVLVAPEPKDALIAVGTTPGAGGYQDIAVVRLTESGQLDPTFGTGGWSIAHFEGNTFRSSVSSAVLQDDGAIVIAGQTPTGRGPAFSVVRVLADGSLDTGFGPQGRQTFLPPDDFAQAIALDDLGRIVVAGTGAVGAPGLPDGIVVYRLWP